MLAIAIFMAGACLTIGEVTVTVKNHWAGGFDASVCLPVDKDLQSWKIRVILDQPITTLETWAADIVDTSSDNTEFLLGNKPFNGAVKAGNKLCVDIQGHAGNSDIAPVITALFDGEESTIPRASHATQGPHAARTTVAGPTAAPVVTPLGTGVSSPLTIMNDWGDRFQGSFSFPLEEQAEGWLVNISFSGPVTKMDITDGMELSRSSDNLHWVLVDKPEKAIVPKGTFQLSFYGNRGDTNGKLAGQAVFINLGVDRNWNITCPPNSGGSKYNYDCSLMLSIMFYETQRSGKLPANKRIPYRGDSALQDKGDSGEDLTGGWYDAGDHVKFNYPMAYSTVVLAWGLLQFKDAYEASGQLQWMYECIKWSLDYLLKCHVADNELYVQVGDGGQDHSYWGRPEDMTMPRPAYKITASKPGSDIAMETAAAFAAGSLAFKEKDPTYSATLLAHAKTLWAFGNSHEGIYSNSVPAAAAYYRSYNTTDELCWGSLWLYVATGDEKYLNDAKKHYDPTPDWGMSWDDKIIGNQILMYNITKDEAHKAAIIGTFKTWLPGGVIPYSPKGLAWRSQWGSLRYTANMAMAAIMAAELGIMPEEYRHWAMCQIHYALGDTGFSYQIGFGDQGYPRRPHHRASSCPLAPAPCGSAMMSSPAPSPHILYGALVGGPGQSDAYKDARDDYVSNEVACDYNAGFQSAVAGLRSLLLRKLHPEQTGHATCPYS